MFFDTYTDELKQTLDQISRADIGMLETWLEEARQNGKHVFVLGNGGSAAAASHWVCDFGKGINVGASKRLKIMAPSDHSSIFTAYGNDNAYWKDMISALRMVGYDYAISIEHEDSLMSQNEGLSKAVSFLKDVLITEDTGAAWWF